MNSIADGIFEMIEDFVYAACAPAINAKWARMIDERKASEWNVRFKRLYGALVKIEKWIDDAPAREIAFQKEQAALKIRQQKNEERIFAENIKSNISEFQGIMGRYFTGRNFAPNKAHNNKFESNFLR